MFALLSMILLEFACRICAKHPQRGREFEKQLRLLDQRYFTQIPHFSVGSNREFLLPGGSSSVLAMLFDLIRNGKAHQYQSAILRLAGGDVDVALTGAGSGRHLNPEGERHQWHLAFMRSPDGDIYLYVRPDCLFLDFRAAIVESELLADNEYIDDVTRGPEQLRFASGGQRSRRPKKADRQYDFTVQQLEDTLLAGGHKYLGLGLPGREP